MCYISTQVFLLCIKYVPIYMQKLNPITKILFEILSGNKNQRWLPGRHFGFPILSEIECDLHFHPSSTSVLNHWPSIHTTMLSSIDFGAMISWPRDLWGHLQVEVRNFWFCMQVNFDFACKYNSWAITLWPRDLKITWKQLHKLKWETWFCMKVYFGLWSRDLLTSRSLGNDNTS